MRQEEADLALSLFRMQASHQWNSFQINTAFLGGHFQQKRGLKILIKKIFSSSPGPQIWRFLYRQQSAFCNRHIVNGVPNDHLDWPLLSVEYCETALMSHKKRNVQSNQQCFPDKHGKYDKFTLLKRNG